jgi:glycosyltransferase involved in cell wall biosynthesis
MAKINILCEQFYFWNMIDHQEGGGEAYVVNLYRLLKQAGHTVKVYQFSYDKKQLRYEDGINSFLVDGLGNIPDKRYTGNELKIGVDEFLEKSKDCDLRILLTVNLAYKTMPSPTISIFHGVYWNFQSESYRMPEWNENFLKRWTRNVDAICSVDTDCINLVRSCYPKNINRFYYIPNFVDCNRFQPTENRDNRVFKVLYARRINELRGIHLFLQAANDLTKKYGDISFTVCGHGLGDAEKQVKQWCDNHRNCNHIALQNTQMHTVYPQYDLNCIPSVASEGLSLSMLEGMACACATLSTDVGGLPNANIPLYTGLMIRANQQEEFTNAIEWCYLNRDKVKEFGENGHKVAQAFDIKIWQQRWLDLINKFIN